MVMSHFLSSAICYQSLEKHAKEVAAKAPARVSHASRAVLANVIMPVTLLVMEETNRRGGLGLVEPSVDRLDLAALATLVWAWKTDGLHSATRQDDTSTDHAILLYKEPH
jgi:hypothetical protein